MAGVVDDVQSVGAGQTSDQSIAQGTELGVARTGDHERRER